MTTAQLELFDLTAQPFTPPPSSTRERVATARLTIAWPEGLHLRTAATLVRLAKRFTSRISILVGQACVDARSLLGLLELGAVAGTPVQVVASGPDADHAVRTITRFFDKRRAR